MREARANALADGPRQLLIVDIQVPLRHAPERDNLGRQLLRRIAQRTQHNAGHFAVERRMAGWQRLRLDLRKIDDELAQFQLICVDHSRQLGALTDRELAEKLTAMGVPETERNIANKIARGGLTAVFFVQRLVAAGCQTVQIAEE